MDDHEDGLEQLGLRDVPPRLLPRPKPPWWVASSSLGMSILQTALWLGAAGTAFANLPTSITPHDAWRLVFPVIASLLAILYAPSVVYNARKRGR